MNAFAVIPAYNEQKHITEVIIKTKKQIDPRRIIVVDDGSRDATAEEAQKAGVAVLRHLINLGKGAALKTGCDYAVMQGADAIILLDSDTQHDPEEIPHFIKALEGADMVFGYRRLGGEMPLVFRFGNWFIGTAVRMLFHMRINDTQCGYRAFKKEAYQKIRWKATDYSVESEMIALTGKHRIKFQQVPVKTIYVDKYKGTTVMDGISIVAQMIWWKFTR